MIYDLVVVGNGLAAQTFLFELNKKLKLDVNKSQNFSIAQVFSEDITPSCSLRSTASVSLSGIEEGISELGDDLRKSFFLFENFFYAQMPCGVEKVRQLITYSNDPEKDKLIRRYKNLIPLEKTHFKSQFFGVELESYLVSPDIYSQWFNTNILSQNLVQIKSFIRSFSTDMDGVSSLELMNGDILKTKKLVLCTGAYAKTFSQFYPATEEFKTTSVVSGAYLERKIDLNISSFYITLDGHNLIYRSLDKTLIIGSASQTGSFLAGDYAELKNILELFTHSLHLNLGSMSEFKTVVGLRHKASKRKPIARALNLDKSIYMINGLYKNGYSFSHLCAEKVLNDLF